MHMITRNDLRGGERVISIVYHRLFQKVPVSQDCPATSQPTNDVSISDSNPTCPQELQTPYLIGCRR